KGAGRADRTSTDLAHRGRGVVRAFGDPNQQQCRPVGVRLGVSRGSVRGRRTGPGRKTLRSAPLASVAGAPRTNGGEPDEHPDGADRSSEGMLHTPLCDLLGIEFPIIQAGMGMGSSAELAVAVSNAGGLGSLGCFRRPPEDLERQLALIRERTGRPFAVNHLISELDETTVAM